MLKNFRNKLLTVAAGGDGSSDASSEKSDTGGDVSTAASPAAHVAVAPDNDTPVSGFICPQCRRDFPDPEALQLHFVSHLEEAAESEKKAAEAEAAAAASAAATPAESKRGSIFKTRGSKGAAVAGDRPPSAATSKFYPGEEAEEFVCPMCEERFALPDQLQVGANGDESGKQ